MKYLLDANTYITAKNFYYAMDICPGYWEWLDKQFTLHVAGSVDMIARELSAGNDELSNWVKARPQHFIANDDHDTQIIFQQIVQTSCGRTLIPAHVMRSWLKPIPGLSPKVKVLVRL